MPSSDLEKPVAFYTLLGSECIVDFIPRYARFLLPDGDSTFSIHRVEELPKGSGSVVYFECEDLDEQARALMSKGIQFKHLPKHQNWLCREARLKDQDGNPLIFYKGG